MLEGMFTKGMNNRGILSKVCHILFAGLLLEGCNASVFQKDERPNNLIPEAVFEQLLVDLALAESAANTNVKNVTNRQTDSVYAFDPLLEHKVRKSQYDSTLIYYSMHIDEYKKVYESVLETLSAMQAAKNHVKADSTSK